MNDTAILSSFDTEKQILEQIDHSLAQIQAGKVVDTEVFDSQMEDMLNGSLVPGPGDPIAIMGQPALTPVIH
jgi:hypothetical protein